jgi:hypothetical protein
MDDTERKLVAELGNQLMKAWAEVNKLKVQLSEARARADRPRPGWNMLVEKLRDASESLRLAREENCRLSDEVMCLRREAETGIPHPRNAEGRPLNRCTPGTCRICDAYEDGSEKCTFEIPPPRPGVSQTPLQDIEISFAPYVELGVPKEMLKGKET